MISRGWLTSIVGVFGVGVGSGPGFEVLDDAPGAKGFPGDLGFPRSYSETAGESVFHHAPQPGPGWAIGRSIVEDTDRDTFVRGCVSAEIIDHIRNPRGLELDVERTSRAGE